MPIFDLSLDELKTYRPPLTCQPDIEQFWRETLLNASQQPLAPTLEAVDYPVPELEAFAVKYHGWQGAPVSAWYLRPPGRGPFPALVFYHGYSVNKYGIYPYLPWVLQGYAVLTPDVRGQSGGTPDTSTYSDGHARGWLTKGIMDPHEYYYRGVYVDSVRALDFLASRPEIDMDKIGVTGQSQGGGLSLAVAALDGRPALAMPGMPFLCHFERPLQISKAYPYWELADYLRHYPNRTDQVFKTLSYFDNMNLADWITCPTLLSVGLIDEICPPSTIFAVYNRLIGPRKIAVFPYHAHEEPQTHWQPLMHWANHFLRGVAPLPPAE